MIGVVIPAHNEAALIGACLHSIRVAASHPQLGGERVLIVVVADGCSDSTEAIAVSLGALVLSTSKRNVGGARDVGARLVVAHKARWLAFTDADTTVPADWLVQQLECATDAGVWRDHRLRLGGPPHRSKSRFSRDVPRCGGTSPRAWCQSRIVGSSV